MSELNVQTDRENAAALAAPKSIKLGGQTYYLSGLSPADFGRLREFARDLALTDVRNPLLAVKDVYKELPPDLLAMMNREAVAQAGGAAKPEPTREAIAEKVTTLEAVRFMFWLSAKKLHPELTREAAGTLVTDDDRYPLMEMLMQTENQQPKPGDPPEISDPKSDSLAGS